MVNATALVNFGNGTGLEIGDWTYSTYLRSAPNYLPLNNASTTYLKTSYPVLAALLPSNLNHVISVTPTLVSSISSAQWSAIAYGNGIWMAGVYGGGAIQTSSNGTTWSNAGLTNPSTAYGIAYGAGVWVSLGGGVCQTSANNGVSWTTRTVGISANGVAFLNNQFLAIRGGVASTANLVSTSPDGITWTVRTTPAGAVGWSYIAYGAGIYVITPANTSNEFLTSPDGITWTLRNFAFSQQYLGIAYGAGKFVIVNGGAANSVLTSTDGINWTSVTATGLVSGCNNLVFGNGLFIALTSSGGIYASTDGISWSSFANVSYGASNPTIAYSTGGVFVSMPNNTSASASRIVAFDDTTLFTLPVVTPVTGTFTYIRAT